MIQQGEYQNAPDGMPHVDWHLLSDLLYRATALTDDTLCQGSSSGGGPEGFFNRNFVEVYDMDVYGRTKIYKDSGPDGQWFSDDDTPAFNPKCRNIYTGREYDPETGMYYYRARYYHPDLGRFISRDPLLYGPGTSSGMFSPC